MQENTETHPSEARLLPLLLKATGLALLIVLVMLFITALGVGVYGYSQLKKFSEAAGMPLSFFYTEIKANWNVQPEKQDAGHSTFLVLGTDTVAGRGNVPPLTDTMLLASLNLQSGKVALLSLPRDIWSPDYKTKINALYSYGSKHTPENPAAFPTNVISEMTGVPIHHTFVITLDTVSELINTLGGIQVTVPESFTDTEFPRPGVDVSTEHNREKLYMTVTFTSGTQTFTGEQALQYIRSRHSSGETGTDTDRNKRQYLVLEALAAKMQSKQVLLNPELMGKLYAFYAKNFAGELSFSEAVRIASTLAEKKTTPEIVEAQLSASSTDKSALLYNPPPRTTNNQWLYVIQDSTAFKAFIRSHLYE